MTTTLTWDAERSAAATRDADDPIGYLRHRFALPDGDVYLDGNSLGALPVGVTERLAEVITKEWGCGLIRSWTDADWWDAPLRVGAKLAPLLGADPGEVAVADSTSVNLFKLLVAGLGMRPDRTVIVTEESNFPTDRYIIDQVAALSRFSVRAVPRAQLADAIGSDTAVVIATHVDYRSSHMLDLPALTASAHEAGALVLWDLAHSAGTMPLELTRDRVDLAVGCGYKFLNGGPGAPAYCYVAARHQSLLRQPLAGWGGHVRPFGFEQEYVPAEGVGRVLCGTPAILSLAALDAALDAFDSVDLRAVRAKSLGLGELAIDLADGHLARHGVAVCSPRDPAVRGSHVSLSHEAAGALTASLKDRGVLCDFRPPGLLRLGLAAPYVRYVDVVDALRNLDEILSANRPDTPL